MSAPKDVIGRINAVLGHLRGGILPRNAEGEPQAGAGSLGSAANKWRRIYAEQVNVGDDTLELGGDGVISGSVDLANVINRRLIFQVGAGQPPEFSWAYSDADAAFVILQSGQGDRWRSGGRSPARGEATTLSLRYENGNVHLLTSGTGAAGREVLNGQQAAGQGLTKEYFVLPNTQGVESDNAAANAYNFNSVDTYDTGFARVAIFVLTGLSDLPALTLTIGAGQSTNAVAAGGNSNDGMALILPLFRGVNRASGDDDAD